MNISGKHLFQKTPVLSWPVLCWISSHCRTSMVVLLRLVGSLEETPGPFDSFPEICCRISCLDFAADSWWFVFVRAFLGAVSMEKTGKFTNLPQNLCFSMAAGSPLRENSALRCRGSGVERALRTSLDWMPSIDGSMEHALLHNSCQSYLWWHTSISYIEILVDIQAVLQGVPFMGVQVLS